MFAAEISFESLALILATTIFLSMLLVPATSRLAYKIGAIDIPNERSSHFVSKPRLGGLAIALSFLSACLAFLPFNNFLLAFLAGLVAVVAIGAIDDIFRISVLWKFFGQFVAAGLFVYLSGMEIEYVGNILGLGRMELGNASFAFTVFCIVGAINAFNLSDGLDGLSSGLSVITTAFFAYFAWSVQNSYLLIIAVSLIGANIGFLRYNCYPARIFMGDSGSLMLGYIGAVLLIALSKTAPQLPVSDMAMVMALPLLDTLWVAARRIKDGTSPFSSDRTHLHHRLLELGWSHSAAVIIIYALVFVFGVMAIFFQFHPQWIIFSSLLGFGIIIFASISVSRRLGFRYQARKNEKFASIRQTQTFKRVAEALDSSARPVGVLVIAGLLMPALFSPLLALSLTNVVTLYSVAMLMLFFSWRSHHEGNQSILHGTLYLTIFALLLIYNLSALADTSWLEGYINTLSGAVLLWVVLMMVFSRHVEIVIASEFELLMLFLCWFVPFVVLKDLDMSRRFLEATQHTCLLSIPFFLAMKINIRNFAESHSWLIYSLMAALTLVGARGG